MSLVRKLIELLIREPPKVAFEDANGSRKVVAYELSITLRGEPAKHQRGLSVEEIPLLGSGAKFLLVREASKKYGLSSRKIRKLCKEGRIICRRSPEHKRQWEVDEESLKTFLKSA